VALGDGALRDGAPGGGATARTVTVLPRPSIPLSSKGWMSYSTRNRAGALQETGASRQSETTPAGVAVSAAVAVPRAVAPELPVHPATETTLSSSAVVSRRARQASSGQARWDSHVRTTRTAAISLTQDAAERT